MKWVNVKDKLPDTNMEVLVFDGEHIVQNVSFSDGEFEDWGSVPMSNFPECITHWMAFPDKPEKEN